MKAQILLFFLLTTFLSYSQEMKKNNYESGTITLINDELIKFSDLNYEGDKVTYINTETGQTEHLFLQSIQKINDDMLNQSIVESKIEESKNLNSENLKIKEDSGLFKPYFPEGIYKTKEDFTKKMPSNKIKLTPKGLYGFSKPELDSIVHSCYFYDSKTDKKIKKTFAISFNGHLYFQVSQILKNRNKTDRAQTSSNPNSFVRVIYGGDNYFYTEADLINQWAQGVAHGGIGGAVGGTLANSLFYGKGLVWDFKNEEFNIFKNCKDYNKFIKEVYPKGIQECKKHHPNMQEVRNAILEIK